MGPAAVTAGGNATLLMDGPGPAIRFVGTHLEGTAAPKTFKPAVLGQGADARPVSGLEIVGKHPEADGIKAEGTFQLTLERVTIRECRHGVHLVKRNRNVLVSASHIYNNRGIGIYLDHLNLHQINVAGSHVSYCKQGGIVSVGGEVRNLQVSGCDIEGNMGKDQKPTANILLDSTGGSIAEVAITGCTIQHESPSPDSANVRILGEGRRRAEERAGQDEGRARRHRGERVLGREGERRRATRPRRDDHRQYVLDGLRVQPAGRALGARGRRPERLPAQPPVRLRRRDHDEERDPVPRLCRLHADRPHVHNVRGVPAAVAMENCRSFNVVGCTMLDCESSGCG